MDHGAAGHRARQLCLNPLSHASHSPCTGTSSRRPLPECAPLFQTPPGIRTRARSLQRHRGEFTPQHGEPQLHIVRPRPGDYPLTDAVRGLRLVFLTSVPPSPGLPTIQEESWACFPGFPMSRCRSQLHEEFTIRGAENRIRVANSEHSWETAKGFDQQ